MAKCASCGSTIVIGGKKQGKLRFCNDECLQLEVFLSALNHVPDDLLEKQIRAVHKGNCPKCHGPGPVDVHTSHQVWSLLVLTSSKSNPQISCRKCGIKAKIRDGVLSLFVGWWGLPWGPIMTPIQVIRNIVGIFHSPDPTNPSWELETMVELEISGKVMQAQAQGVTQPSNQSKNVPHF